MNSILFQLGCCAHQSTVLVGGNADRTAKRRAHALTANLAHRSL